jgi:hypothetical protein
VVRQIFCKLFYILFIFASAIAFGAEKKAIYLTKRKTPAFRRDIQAFEKALLALAGNTSGWSMIEAD